MTSIADPSNLVDAGMFDQWLEDMQPRLYRFVDFRRPDSVPGDFSRKSLEALEAYLLERYPEQELYLNDPDVDFVDGAVRYVGETYLRAFGGGWRHSDDPQVAVRYTPYLILDTPGAVAIAPYYLMSALLHRRTGQVLVKVYNAQQRRIAEHQAADPSFAPKRESVPGVFLSEADEEQLQDRARPSLDAWLPEMDARIDQWRAGLPPGTAARLDGTLDSLPALEEVLLDRLAAPDEAEADTHAEFVDGAARYIGSVFLREGGGDWCYVPGDPSSVFMGRPFLERRDKAGDLQYVSPHRVIRSTVKKRTPGVATTMFKNYAA